jgi:hypothetical protein
LRAHLTFGDARRREKDRIAELVARPIDPAKRRQAFGSLTIAKAVAEYCADRQSQVSPRTPPSARLGGSAQSERRAARFSSGLAAEAAQPTLWAKLPVTKIGGTLDGEDVAEAPVLIVIGYM